MVWGARRRVVRTLGTVGVGLAAGCLGAEEDGDSPAASGSPDVLSEWLPASTTLFEHQQFGGGANGENRSSFASLLGVEPNAIETVTLFGLDGDWESGWLAAGGFDVPTVLGTVGANRTVETSGTDRGFETLELQQSVVAVDEELVVLTATRSDLETILAASDDGSRLLETGTPARAALAALPTESHVSYRDVVALSSRFPTLSPVGVTDAVQVERAEEPSTLAAAFEAAPDADTIDRIEGERDLTHLETTDQVATFEGYAFDGGERASTTPQVSFGFEGDASELRIVHEAGDSIAADQLSIAGDAYEGATTRWAALDGEDSNELIQAGDRITIGTAADCECAIASDGGRIRLVFEGADDRQAVLAAHDVPAA
jgi:hypothetical protein